MKIAVLLFLAGQLPLATVCIALATRHRDRGLL